MIAEVLTGRPFDAQEDALARLAARFAAAGYRPVAVGHLFPAETLLDLYGEDLRTRAYIFPGGRTGRELCLRPDFTLPVVLAHAERGWTAEAAFSYQGPIFRRQPDDPARPNEYLQAGLESLGRPDRIAADADVFATLMAALRELTAAPLSVQTGDLGVVFALLDAIGLSDRRRALLRRHVWRPARFHALVESFRRPPSRRSERRAALIGAAGDPDRIAGLAAAAGEVQGARELEEIAERAADLAEAAAEPALPDADARLIEQTLSIAGPLPEAVAKLRRLAPAALAPAIARLEERCGALAEMGEDPAAMGFDADFGRKLEYYDGFVFEVAAAGRPDLPALAGGGRYDALTLRLGAPDPMPAIGGMIRPQAALASRP